MCGLGECVCGGEVLVSDFFDQESIFFWGGGVTGGGRVSVRA